MSFIFNPCPFLGNGTTRFLVLAASGGLILAATSSVTNVRASQRAGIKLLDIDYDLAGSERSPVTVSIQVSADGSATGGVAATTILSGSAVGTAVQPGLNNYAAWNVGAEWAEQLTSKRHVRGTTTDTTAPSGMALIPGGEFTMGDTFNEGSSDERPTHTVEVSAFYMDRTEVTLALWREVRDWGIVAGYTFDNEGLGKGLTHPVHTVSWYDAVKWCNARSRQENRTPAYYTDAGLTQEYKTGFYRAMAR